MGIGPFINVLKTYFDIAPNTIVGIQDDPKDTNEGDLKNLDTTLYNTLQTQSPKNKTRKMPHSQFRRSHQRIDAHGHQQQR
jgi:hypothetical protein